MTLNFNICGRFCGIYGEINLWPSVNYTLSSTNVAENWDCSIIFIQVSHSEFEDRGTDGQT
jgi:hypothetical protein